jgi:RNA polymerase sigma-70 factor, ECF subfamily
VKREAYVGSWLPEPLVEDDTERQVENEEAVSLAFLVLLERLNPDERAVLVLRESFDYEYADIAEILGISAANARQILSRARRRVADERPRFDPDPRERRALAARFLDAARNGDMEGLVAMLAPDALMVGDGGGKARSLPAPLQGAAEIARALVAFGRLGERWGTTFEPAVVNGQPGFRTVAPDGKLVNVVAIEIEGGVVRRIYSMLNPDKLGHLGPLSDLGLRPAVRPAPPA